MKKHIFLSITFIFILCMLIPSASALDDPGTAAKSAYVVEKSSGQVLYAKDEDAQVYPASTTKIMTTLLVLEAADRGDLSLYGTITASNTFDADLAEDGSTSNIQPGEVMTVEELLDCVLIASANEACNILAEAVSGSTDAFVALMNERAAALGCTGTHFANAHGLPDADHYTTAHDMYLMVSEALTHSLFKEITATVTKTLPMTNMSEIRKLETTNSLINPESDNYYEKTTGGKTGYTKEAGQCLVSTARDGDLEIICVIMGVNIRGENEATVFAEIPEENHLTATKDLCEWVFANYSYQDVLSTSERVATAPVLYGDGTDSVGLVPEGSVSMLLPNDYSADDIVRSVTLSSDEGETAPITAGQVMGEMTLAYGDRTYGPVKLVAASAVELSRSAYMLSHVKATLSQPIVIVAILVFVLLFVLYFVYAFRMRAKRRKNRRNRSRRS